VFAFGIGSSVNRFLLDKMAEAGRGEVEYVGGYIVSSGVLNNSALAGVAAGTGSGSGGAKAPPPPNSPPVVTVTASTPELRQKLHRSVLAVVERLRKKEAVTSADETGFIRNGKAEVQVWLTEKSEANLAKLKELGFEVLLDPKSPRLIIGQVSIDKLEALAKLTFVSYISPQVSK
jgi:hypothetical protein